MIRARLRLAGRLLFAVKKINKEITDFASIYNPKAYDSVVEAIRTIAGFDSRSNEFKSPATAAAAVTHVKQIAVYLIAEWIKKDEPENQRTTENFLKLMQSDISVAINKTVFEQQCQMRREKEELLPTTDDIKKFAVFLDREREQCYNEVYSHFTFKKWLLLTELTVTSIILFNRRRTGEVQNIKLIDFENRRSIDENTELFQSLSEDAKQIARKYRRILIRGKRTRPVAALLKPDVERCVELIVKHRNQAGIASHNPFLFAMPTCAEYQIKVVDAVRAIRTFSDMCGAVNPERLRGTTIRKNMASVCISFELNDNAVAEIADYMGHHEKIHREYYRKNPIQNEFVKISQMLEKAQGNDGDDEDSDEVECGVDVDPQTATYSSNDLMDYEKEAESTFEDVPQPEIDQKTSTTVRKRANIDSDQTESDELIAPKSKLI
ncbi:uncharacterized protein LOC119067001 [Bradysia coprophila]|uniref:uncharacterized protein LOC119067001 n=1 Tax=Bradysia coprophila TaxID=38358 RepID=UPI00187DA178|nr:uncharacterized protein LOC119067001 [Bradysia coprophila]